MKKGFIFTLLLLMAAAPFAKAWDKTGHRVVARIAETHMSEAAKVALVEIMGTESLVEASTWPDWVRSDFKWRHASVWHYVNVPDGMRYPETEKNEAGDAYTALTRYLELLKKGEAEIEDKRVAIRWIAHLVGDLHQPLHVGRSEDRGGNAIKSVWFGEDTNLHHIWDKSLIDSTDYSFSEYAELIDRRVVVEIELGEVPDILRWINESQDLRDRAYATPKQNKYGAYDYIYQNLWVVEYQLKAAGLRLAKALEYALVDTE